MLMKGDEGNDRNGGGGKIVRAPSGIVVHDVSGIIASTSDQGIDRSTEKVHTKKIINIKANRMDKYNISK